MKPSTWKKIKIKARTAADLDRFIEGLKAEAEVGGYAPKGEERTALGHLIRRDGITYNDAVEELLRRVKAHRSRAKKQRRVIAS